MKPSNAEVLALLEYIERELQSIKEEIHIVLNMGDHLEKSIAKKHVKKGASKKTKVQ